MRRVSEVLASWIDLHGYRRIGRIYMTESVAEELMNEWSESMLKLKWRIDPERGFAFMGIHIKTTKDDLDPPFVLQAHRDPLIFGASW